MNKTYLLLGSNMGNSRQQLLTAIKNITQQIGTVTRQSSLYATAAWGNLSQPDFLNQVIVVETTLKATETIDIILHIENAMGRIRTIKNAPRTIDIDILFFNKQIITEKKLIVPHPEIANRRFVLIPLNQLSPNFTHPVSGKNIHQLLAECTDALDVKKF
jgi:2-amino-4-hydroxy-6-hydroxymethyldihydropteridine diphosphokinase